MARRPFSERAAALIDKHRPCYKCRYFYDGTRRAGDCYALHGLGDPIDGHPVNAVRAITMRYGPCGLEGKFFELDKMFADKEAAALALGNDDAQG